MHFIYKMSMSCTYLFLNLFKKIYLYVQLNLLVLYSYFHYSATLLFILSFLFLFLFVSVFNQSIIEISDLIYVGNKRHPIDRGELYYGRVKTKAGL